MLDLIEEDESLYEVLLSRALERGTLVLWLGERLDQGSQAAFRLNPYTALIFLVVVGQIGYFFTKYSEKANLLKGKDSKEGRNV